MDEPHEHRAIRSAGNYSAEYPGMPDAQQGRAVPSKTYIVGDQNQLGPVPPKYVSATRGRDITTEDIVRAAHDSAIADALAEHGIYFTDQAAVRDAAAQADQDNDGLVQ